MEELGVFLNESVAAGTEGLIVKSLDSTYEPSKRSAHWLKLKKDYMEGVGDTFDVVPIGAWHGKCVFPPSTRTPAVNALPGPALGAAATGVAAPGLRRSTCCRV